VSSDCLKLTIYFGERTRAGDRFLADALIDVFARHELRTSVLLRGVHGFGARHALRTDRLLSLSEDLPVAAVAVDARVRIEAALADVEALRFPGLVTLERAAMPAAAGGDGGKPVLDALHDETKLTVYVGRHERSRGRPAAEAIVDVLHGAGVAGATVLLGVDGTAHGARRRASFVARNGEVPLMIISVGDGRRIAQALPDIASIAERPILTLERVRVCRRDGVRLAEPHDGPAADESGLGIWQKLMVYTGEDVQHDGRPLHRELVTALRRAGAAGATSLRGVWGFHGDHAPHGDTLWQLRRRAPIVTVVVDRPDRARAWFRIADELTATSGLVTSELVPAYRATTQDRTVGGLRPAQRIP
jgi:PII-like signaling protein